MKNKIYTGFEVVSEDFTGSCFSSKDIEACKRYCRKGCVIVRTYRKRIGFAVRVFWHKWYRPFEFRPHWRELNILWLHVRWEAVNKDEWENVAIWKPETTKAE